jgi:bifunctional ADP-heptose synthase (sugar kinase/adenylyltransferase)
MDDKSEPTSVIDSRTSKLEHRIDDIEVSVDFYMTPPHRTHMKERIATKAAFIVRFFWMFPL